MCARRQRLTSTDGVEIVVFQLLRKVLFRRGIVYVFARIHVLHIKHTHVVDAVRNVFLQKNGIVAHAVRKAVVVQPHAATDALFPDGKYGIQSRTSRQDAINSASSKEVQTLFFKIFVMSPTGTGSL